MIDTIDHTLLTEATEADIAKLCDEATTYEFRAVCVRPEWVAYAQAHTYKVATVVGFPLQQSSMENIGAYDINHKVKETLKAVQDGADEIDMVLHVNKFLQGNYTYTQQEIHEVVQAAQGRMVKVIVEACYLNDEQLQRACETVTAEEGFHCVKTSTGFAESGADLRQVSLMRGFVGSKAMVKASGGIKTYQQAQAMLDAGADILGTSKGVEITGQYQNQ